MCYGVLEEINQVKKCEESRQQKLPQPHYLFVQKYGRNLETDMPEIAGKLEKGCQHIKPLFSGAGKTCGAWEKVWRLCAGGING